MTDTYHQENMQNDPKYAKHFNALQAMPKEVRKSKKAACATVITIPVAVHFNDPIDCSSSSCLLSIVESQIAVMNEDFMAANADYQDYLDLNSVCSTSYPLATAPTQNEGACVQFCLARMNHPEGSDLSDGDPAITIGINDWPSAPDWDGYLNIFVSASQSGLGISPLPGSADGDGFWVKNTSFGGPDVTCFSGGNLNTSNNYNLGRTATHEAGHYLGLPHVFGSVCSQDPDTNPPGPLAISDTPKQSDPFFGTATVNNCADVPEECPGEPSSFFNFMDYTNDIDMIIFTADQSEVINWHAENINFKSDVTYCAGTYGSINCISAPNCVDGIQNQDEQDIDCGGINCADCLSYCGKDFFDPGGPNSNYFNNSVNEWTFCPDNANQLLSITFDEWNVENNSNCNWDVMTIYNGANDEAPVLGNWCTNSPGIVFSTIPGGCLHVVFEADFSVTEEGWEATIACSTIIPVELSHFSGFAAEFGNRLNWTTEVELNNAGFEIQRSVDAIDFETIAFVEGSGNSEQTIDYTFLDTNTSKGVDFYYRLNQIDKNNNESYSHIVSIKSINQEVLHVYPNPVLQGTLLNVELNWIGIEVTDYEIFNINGRLVQTNYITKGSNQLYIPDLEKGLYVLRIKAADSSKAIVKFMVI